MTEQGLRADLDPSLENFLTRSRASCVTLPEKLSHLYILDGGQGRGLNEKFRARRSLRRAPSENDQDLKAAPASWLPFR